MVTTSLSRRVWLALMLALALPICLLPAQRAAAEGTALPTVIVLSWDGMRYDYMDLAHFPGLERMARDGVRADRLTPVFPSDTFPGHVSLATGTYPDRHGIVDNHFYDRERGWYRMGADANWIEAEPLWIAAERQGVPAATYFWVGSESDWHGQGTRFRIAPFDGSRPEAAKVDQILAWLALPAAERPRLIMSYWRGADSDGHRFGPSSDRIVEAVTAQDAELQRLLAGLDRLDRWATTTLLLVSDHGMTEGGDYLDLTGALAEAGIGAEVSGSAVANVYVSDAADVGRAGEVLRQFENVTLYAREALPQRLRVSYPGRIGDWLVVARPPYTFSRPSGYEGLIAAALSAVGWGFGNHGYDPSLPEMGATFLALGRAVPAGLAVHEVQQIDVAPTVARLLGINPPLQSEGRPVPGIGEP